MCTCPCVFDFWCIYQVTLGVEGSTMSGSLQRRKKSKRKWKRLWFLLKDKVLYTFTAREVRGHRVSHTSPKIPISSSSQSLSIRLHLWSVFSHIPAFHGGPWRDSLCSLCLRHLSVTPFSSSWSMKFFCTPSFFRLRDKYIYCISFNLRLSMFSFASSGKSGFWESTSAGLHCQTDRETRGRGKQQRFPSVPQEDALLHLQSRRSTYCTQVSADGMLTNSKLYDLRLTSESV